MFMVVSTYGEGDPPDNAQDFQTWLMDETLSEDLLKDVKYTVRNRAVFVSGHSLVACAGVLAG